MSRVESFPPIAAPDSVLLILGSMPGPASLAKGEYYGHPQNLFWRILGEVVGFDPGLAYPGRVRALLAARIAVWDVLRSCTRPGALDSAIVLEDAEMNDFGTFLMEHPRLKRIVFNGSTAETLFRRRVAPTLGVTLAEIECVRVPSTSPANAAVPLSRKMDQWRHACGTWTTSLTL